MTFSSRGLGRTALALALSVCLEASVAHQGEAHGAAPRSDDVRAALASAEAALQRGDGQQALAQFQRAAEREHALDIELGIVRAHLQAGEYRRALAFASHVAGAHADEPEGAAAYAWLLMLGGQQAPANRVLEAALQRHPSEASLAALRSKGLDALADRAGGFRLALAPTGASLPRDATLAATGVLVDGGRRVLVPRAGVAAGPLWVRDGLGRTIEAEVESRDAAPGIAVLRLRDAHPSGAEARLLAAPRDAFAGSPMACLSFAAHAEASVALPVVRTGFLEAADPRDGWSRIADDVCAGNGGVVVDLQGRLPAQDHRLALVTATALQRKAGERMTVATGASAGRVPLDAIYESGLRWAVQVLSVRPAAGLSSLFTPQRRRAS